MVGSNATPKHSYIISTFLVLTPGYQLFQAANNTAALKDVPKDRHGTISGLLGLSRNIGLIAGASATSIVFTLGVGTEDIAHATATAIANGMRLTFLQSFAIMVIAIIIGRPMVYVENRR